MNVCMRVHMCVLSSTTITSEQKALCSGPPLAPSSSLPGKETPFVSEAPSTWVPSIPYPNGTKLVSSAYVSPFFRSGVLLVCAAQHKG